MNNNYSSLVRATDNVIRDYATYCKDDQQKTLSFDSLSLYDQSNLSRAYIEWIDRDVYECFFNPTQNMQEDEVTCALLSLLKDPTKENKDNLSELILCRAASAYRNQIQELIDERCAVLTADDMEEHGLYRVQIDETDYGWRRLA